MHPQFMQQIFNHRKTGYAYLKPDLSIGEKNDWFSVYLLDSQRHGNELIYTWIPELIGTEKEIHRIRTNLSDNLVLENINRETKDGKDCFLTISVFPTGEDNLPLVCLIEDVSYPAHQKQQMQQQEYSIRMLESRLQARGVFEGSGLIGESEPIQKVRQFIEKMSCVDNSAILLFGETGTGKSLTAQLIHSACRKGERPFVEISCAAIPESLLESELFGYEKGAFTNATATKKGLLEKSNDGTLFLDEIGELSMKLQAKLLLFLETRRFRRVGSTEDQQVKVRVIAATNRRLDKMVENGQFREDLYYRLNVVSYELPPLRELGRDILTIAAHFVNRFNRQFHQSIRLFSPEAESDMLRYRWLGNMRELRNVIERAMIFAEGEILEAQDLNLFTPAHYSNDSEALMDSFRLPSDGLAFDDIEKNIFKQAMVLAAQNQSKAARLLHMSRDAFRYRLEKHRLL